MKPKFKISKLQFLFFVLVLTVSCNSKSPSDKKITNFPSEIIKPESAIQFVTAANTEFRLTQLEKLTFGDVGEPDEHEPCIIVDPGMTFQTIEGFGGAITDAAAETFYKLPVEKQQEILKAYFNPTEGIGYSLCRTHINSCDFSSESYSYCEVPGDTALLNFSIEHDLKYRVPLIKAALNESENRIKFFASPWSPPAWMKSNENMLQGGSLKAEYFGVWSDYYVRFIEEYGKQGIDIWGLTVQNEPAAVQKWESCIYTAEEERDFVKNHIGPTLEKAGMSDIKLIIWDHNRGNLYQRAQVAYSDPEASKYIWGAGFHWYTGDHFDNVQEVKEAFPDKNLLFTEGCVFPFNYDSLQNWHWGETYGKSILLDIKNGASGWVDWNIMLDETGGPNHVQNFCYAPVIGNTKTGEVIYMNSFYYLGHFSKFIRPGARRIACSSNSDDLLATAAINPDGKIAVVILNLTDKDLNYKLRIDSRGVKTSILNHSVTTLILN